MGVLFQAVTPGFRLLPHFVFTILESLTSSHRDGVGEEGGKERNLRIHEDRESQSPRGHFWEERGRGERLDFLVSFPALIRVGLLLITSHIKIRQKNFLFRQILLLKFETLQIC